MKTAYGGIVIDTEARVLLREPKDRSSGVAWTFAKGKAKPGESPEEAALREVLEETGVQARILAPIPGAFEGSDSICHYFLMLPIEEARRFDSETRSVRWASGAQASELISLTQKPGRRKRDLRALESAFAVFRSLFGPGESFEPPTRATLRSLACKREIRFGFAL